MTPWPTAVSPTRSSRRPRSAAIPTTTAGTRPTSRSRIWTTTPPAPAVTNRDDDPPDITPPPPSRLVRPEAGGPATFTGAPTTPPTPSVPIGLSSPNTGEGTVSPASLTFPPANWNVAQTVTIT